jgi:hypothetical protein
MSYIADIKNDVDAPTYGYKTIGSNLFTNGVRKLPEVPSFLLIAQVFVPS